MGDRMSSVNKINVFDLYGIELGFNLQRILTEDMVTYKGGVITIRQPSAPTSDLSKWFASKMSLLPPSTHPKSAIAVLIYENANIRHAEILNPLS